jgi:hypothetical protein
MSQTKLAIISYHIDTRYWPVKEARALHLYRRSGIADGADWMGAFAYPAAPAFERIDMAETNMEVLDDRVMI